MLPAFAIAIFSVIFALIGRIIFACIPALKPTILNIAIFVAGGWLGAIVALGIDDRFHYVRYMEDPALFYVPIAGGAISGLAVVLIRTRYFTHSNKKV